MVPVSEEWDVQVTLHIDTVIGMHMYTMLYPFVRLFMQFVFIRLCLFIHQSVRNSVTAASLFSSDRPHRKDGSKT